MLPFMYDGVVISYRDPKIIEALGRENSINKYSMAIKFNPLVREAVFTGYTYTIGQDGTITPMIHYTPVEFYGTIHTKSSGHSFKRFNDLQLAIGDIIKVEYTNDVMPYVTKPELNANFSNSNPPEMFIENCPCCGHKIIINESGKSAMCPNLDCPERVVSRMSNMMAKLNLKDFGEETFRFLGTKSLSELLNYTFEDIQSLGHLTAEKLLSRINEIKTTPIYDYKVMGSIGFTGIAIETWKKILKVIPLADIVYSTDDYLDTALNSIKGIGPATVAIILHERQYLREDLNTIINGLPIISSFGIQQTGKIIRFTGCRPNADLVAYLESKNCDARGDAGVTKATDVLVVPYIGFSSSKTSKVRDDAIIVDMAEFEANPDKFIL